jgi:hypothetical protein
MFTPGIRAHGTVAGTKNADAYEKSTNRVGNKRPSNHFLTVSSVKSTRIFLLFLTVAYVSENINRTNYQYAIVSWDISRHAIVYQSTDRGTQFHVGHYFILHNTRQGLS